MKSTVFSKTFTCVGILFLISGFVNCQRRTATRRTGPRLIGGGVRSLSPSMRVRNMGGMSVAGPLANQTTSRRGSPRLLGFIIPNSRGGRPQLRLMPGAQDFIRPGRRIAAAPLSQLQRLGGARTRIGTGRRGSGSSPAMTGIPTSLLGRTRTRSGARGSVRGPVRSSQIRRLPQSALNTISAARGRTPTRQPNIVFVRPPTRSRTTGLTPELIRQIRQTALRRAAAQRAAASGRRGIRRNQTIPQPTAQLRNMARQNGIRGAGTILRSRAGPRSREELEAVRRRISAMNAARGRTAMPTRQARPVAQVSLAPQAPRQTEIRKPNMPRPTRVDEAVLRANIVPAGLTTGSDSLRTVVSSSSSSSESSTSTSSSSKTSTVSSGSGVGGIAGVVQTGVQAVQPVATVIAPAPELDFRTGVDDTASAAVIAPGAGLVASVPVLETGPTFQVVSNVPSPTIVAAPGTAISQAVSLDVGAAAGPAMVVNPTVIDNTESLATLVGPAQAGVGVAAVKPVEEITVVSGGAIPSIDEANVVAAVASPPISGSAVSALVPAVTKVDTPVSSDVQLISSLPDLGQLQVSEIGAFVPGAVVGQLGTGDVATSIAKSNPDMHSLKSVITDVLRDMAVHGKSSNVEPDISVIAQAVLDAQRKNDAASLASASSAHAPHAEHNSMHHHHPVLQQTFTLGPENPTLIVDPHTLGSLLTNTTSPKHDHSTFISPKGTNQQDMLTTKPAITAKMSTDKQSSLEPGLTDSAISAGLNILGPHDFTVGHADIASLLAGHTHMPGSAHDSGHHTHSPGPIHDILLHTHSPGPTHDLVHHGHTGVLDTTKHKNTQTAKLQPTTAAPKTNDQLNLIVGDWTGADKALSPPPPPPTSNLAMDHSHGHGHFHDHTHGFTEPAIPRPPPLAEAFASSGIPSHSDPTSASVKQSANKVQTSNEQISAIKGTSIGENKKAGFGDVIGVNNNLPGTNMEQINSKAGANLGQGKDQLSNLFLDMAQLEQVLGLDPNSLAASQTAQVQPTSGSPTDSAKMQSFLTELSSLFGTQPRETVNSPVIKQSLVNITQPVENQVLNEKIGKGTAAILSTPQDRQTTFLADNSASPGTNKSVQSPDVTKPTKAKTINASTTIDKSVDLKKSSSMNNQTISKRVRQINITTTITKKTKPVLNGTTEKDIKRKRKTRTKKGRRRGRVGNDLGVNFAPDAIGIGNDLGISYAPDVGITGNDLGVNFDASGIGVTESIISGSVGTGMRANGGPFGVTDPNRAAHVRAEALDTMFDALGEGGVEDFSANNMQGTEGVSIAVPTGASASDVTIDNINTIAIENKLFDANMPMATTNVEIPSASTLDTKPLLPVNVIAETPSLDTSQPLGEQLMKQLPVPQELVNALSGGITDLNTPSGNSVQGNTAITDSLILGNAFREVNSQARNLGEGMPDQGFSLNNVRDGLIVDAVPPIIQTGTITTDDTNLQVLGPNLGNDRLSAPSLDKLALNIPSDILATPNNVFDNTVLSNTASATSLIDPNLATINTDPTIRKIANILPTTKPKLPLMTLDAKGFSAEGRFNAVQQGFNKTTKLSSKNGINVEMQLSPFFTSKTESTHSETSKQVARTANIQTDGSFLGSPLPVPPQGAGPGIPLSSTSNEMPFFDQSALLGSLNQIVPIDVPVLPPPIDIPLVADDAPQPAVIAVSSAQNEIKPDPSPVSGMPPPPTVSFTSTFDVPTTFVDQNIASPVDTTGGAVQTEFVSLENNPNWAVFDPTAVSSDINFNDINPVINGVIAPGPEIAFVNTNDITFTNAFDVAPVAYDPAASAPTTGVLNDSILPQQNSPVEGSPKTTPNSGGSISKSTDTFVDTLTNRQPSGNGVKFEEVVIAPLPFDSNRNVQSSMNFPPPPPI